MSPAQDDVPDKFRSYWSVLEGDSMTSGRTIYSKSVFSFTMTSGTFRTFMETEVIPMIVQNPGMQTFLGIDRLSVRDKVST